MVRLTKICPCTCSKYYINIDKIHLNAPIFGALRGAATIQERPLMERVRYAIEMTDRSQRIPTMVPRANVVRQLSRN